MKKTLNIIVIILFANSIALGQEDPVIDSLENVIAEIAKPVYIETYKIVNTAKFKINNAVAGRYPTKEAISYYNDNLSLYMGNYKTIQAIKKRLDTAGDAFVKVVYLREKERIAKTLADRENEKILEFQAEQSFEDQKAKKQGTKEADLITLPATINSSNDEVVSNQVDYDPVIFTKVEKEAQFPGGPSAWRNFLERNLRGEVASDNGAASGTYSVILKFVVDVAGNVSDVKVIKDPGFGMGGEAIRVIKRSGKWKPAIQNGREVKAYCKVPITFAIHEVAPQK